MYIKVVVFPDFKQELIEKTGPDSFKMYIREEAMRGAANKKVLKVLNGLYPNKRIRIVSGALSTKKLIEIK
jgi:uncharacterized protein YggU (UPF0235/DUF167 family)